MVKTEKNGKVFLKVLAWFLALAMTAGILGPLQNNIVKAEGITNAGTQYLADSKDAAGTETRYLADSGDNLTEAIVLSSSKKWVKNNVDEDHSGYYYCVNIYAASVLKLTLKNGLSGDESIRFWNKTGTTEDIDKYTVESGKSKKRTYYVEPGTYYIYCGRVNQGDAGSVSLKCQWKKAGTSSLDNKDNAAPENAADISNENKAFTGMLGVADAGDYYKVRFDSYGLKEVKIKNSAGDMAQVTVYDGEKYAEAGTLELLEKHVMKKGEVYSYNVNKESGVLYILVSGKSNGKYTLTPVWNITSKSVKVIGRNIKIHEGETKKVITKVLPDNASDDSYYIKSNNLKIAGVASNKSITGCKAGKTKITIYYGRDFTKVGQVYKHKIVCNVTVVKAEIKKITLKKSKVTLQRGKKYTCRVSLKPEDADESDLNYKSSNPKVAKVNQNGVISGLSTGKAVITVSSSTNPKVKAKCNVTVTPILLKKITFSKKSFEIKNGQALKLSKYVKKAPKNADNKKLEWSSSNTSAATVDGSGNVRAVGGGTVTITAKSQGNPSVKASVTIKINCIIKSVSISKSTLSLDEGSSADLTASVSPTGTKYNTVSWVSSNTGVATVSQSGKVTAVGEGTAVITAISTENANARASCTVTVKGKEEVIEATGIEISPQSAVVGKGKSVTLSADLKPSGAKGTVSWSVADPSKVSIEANGNKVKVTGKEFGTTYLTASIGGVKKTVSIAVQ